MCFFLHSTGRKLSCAFLSRWQQQGLLQRLCMRVGWFGERGATEQMLATDISEVLFDANEMSWENSWLLSRVAQAGLAVYIAQGDLEIQIFLPPPSRVSSAPVWSARDKARLPLL